jgi:hypothetical protein
MLAENQTICESLFVGRDKPKDQPNKKMKTKTEKRPTVRRSVWNNVFLQFVTVQGAEDYIKEIDPHGRMELEIVMLPHNPRRKKTVRSRGGMVVKEFGYRQSPA